MTHEITNSLLIFDFEKKTTISDWKIVDDVVMGGRSNGNFYLSEKGNGIFEGKVSLENNGGFSSLRYNFERKKIDGYKKIKIHLKGDGKRYQFRVKTSRYDKHSYVSNFETGEEWETITLDLADMIPTFRGRELTELSNYDAESLEEIAFLIGNKTEQNFKLEIDKIELMK
jgi:hypothetical protein